jgi:hypothetical protein
MPPAVASDATLRVSSQDAWAWIGLHYRSTDVGRVRVGHAYRRDDLCGGVLRSWSGSALDTVEVGGEQPAACRVPLGVARAGLGQHRTEHDDVARGEPGEQRRLCNTSVDDPLNNRMDLGANSSRCEGGGRWSAVQGQDEFVALGDGGFDEQAQALEG